MVSWTAPLDGIRIVRIADHSFLTGPVTPGATIVDLGVNQGEFALAMLDRFDCSVIGVEPVPDLFHRLPIHDRLQVEALAVTADGEPTSLYLNRSITAATIDRRLSDPTAPELEVAGVTLSGLLDRHGVERAQLVKVDIEGAETEMILSASVDTLQRVDQFTVEFHDFVDPSLADEVAQARRRLREVGFAELSLSGDHSDVLFVNLRRIRFGPFQRLTAAAAYKYPRALRRKIARRSRALRARSSRPNGTGSAAAGQGTGSAATSSTRRQSAGPHPADSPPPRG